MPQGATRRGLLRELARQIAPAIPDGTAALGDAPGSVDTGSAARPPTALATPADLRRLALEHGLEQRLPELERLAVAAARLTPIRPREPASWYVGGRRPRLQLDLAALAASTPDDASAFPAEGHLRLVLGTEVRRSADGASVACEARAGVWRTEGQPAGAQGLALSGERVIPRPWSAAVEELDLSDEERTGWSRLRVALADLQGVEAADLDRPDAPVHRASGYADERTGLLPPMCDALHPPRPEDREVPAFQRWRLLLQLSAGAGLAWPWGEEHRRLYVWVSRRDLSRGAFRHAVAILR